MEMRGVGVRQEKLRFQSLEEYKPYNFPENLSPIGHPIIITFRDESSLADLEQKVVDMVNEKSPRDATGFCLGEQGGLLERKGEFNRLYACAVQYYKRR